MTKRGYDYPFWSICEEDGGNQWGLCDLYSVQLDNFRATGRSLRDFGRAHFAERSQFGPQRLRSSAEDLEKLLRSPLVGHARLSGVAVETGAHKSAASLEQRQGRLSPLRQRHNTSVPQDNRELVAETSSQFLAKGKAKGNLEERVREGRKHGNGPGSQTATTLRAKILAAARSVNSRGKEAVSLGWDKQTESELTEGEIDIVASQSQDYSDTIGARRRGEESKTKQEERARALEARERELQKETNAESRFSASRNEKLHVGLL